MTYIMKSKMNKKLYEAPCADIVEAEGGVLLEASLPVEPSDDPVEGDDLLIRQLFKF